MFFLSKKSSTKLGLFLFFALVWALFITLSTSNVYLAGSHRGFSDWLDLFWDRFYVHALWLGFTPIIWFLAAKHPTAHWPKKFLFFLIWGITLCFVYATLLEIVLGLVGKSHFFTMGWVHNMQFHILRSVPIGFLVYVSILGLCLIMQNHQRMLRQKLELSEMTNLLNEAKLAGLKMQLRPHFLFNTLNTISAYVERDPIVARKMIAGLSELLRSHLEFDQQQLISLEKEFHFLTKYLEIEQIRMQDRLKLITNMDPVAMKALVPSLLLQPLVENAIRHGINTKIKGGTIQIGASKVGHQLHLTVSDDGPGLDTSDFSFDQAGVGLRNTKQRLQQLYGELFELEIQGVKDEGTLISISIPFQLTNSIVQANL